MRTMKSIIKRQAARLAALLVLAALLCAGLQAAVAAEEQTLTMSIGQMKYENATDPTISRNLKPGVGDVQDYHYFTHQSDLIEFDGNGNIIPWMAESYEVSNDYKTVTFHLRKGIKFADGTPLNASVLKFNFDRIYTYGLIDFCGKNGSNKPICVNYDYSEASDEYTFKIHLTRGWPDLAREIAISGAGGRLISPSDVVPAWDIQGTLKPDKMYNGLGPYYVDENESIPMQKIVLKRRHNWRDDYDFHRPKLDKIVLTLIADTNTAVMALEKGEIDLICRYWNAPLDALPKLEENPDISIKKGPETNMYYIWTAYWKEPFSGNDGMLFRKAICYALNRTEMAKGAFNGYAAPATDSIFLSPRRSDAPKCCGKGYDYDLDKAKQLLAEAGWNDSDHDGILDKNGKALKDLDLVISSASYLGWQKDIALLVQSQLKKIGINVKIRTVESSVYSELQKTRGDFDMIMGYQAGNSWSSAQELTNAFNRKGYFLNRYINENGTLEAIAENAKMAVSEEEWDKYICQAINILYEEAGMIPLVYQMQYAVMSSKVKGFELAFYSSYFKDHFEECWIEK